MATDDTDRTITSFDELRPRVMPILKPLEMLLTVRDRELPMIVYRPFLGDLMIAYVIGEGNRVAYINEQHLERWQISSYDLHEQAIINLRKRTDETGSYTATGEGAQRLIIFNTQDGFDATRLLLPDLLAELRGQFPGHMVIGIPNRDFMILFSDAEHTILANVASQIDADATQKANGLTDRLFTLDGGEVREYMWE
ncbi:DUF1444 family protein [Chloroflexales bacterium ZM16-3]|nr:DUF1444 family protein [Chloroflexales bacterium ZM16-3]